MLSILAFEPDEKLSLIHADIGAAFIGSFLAGRDGVLYRDGERAYRAAFPARQPTDETNPP
jgi:hypothetical protein